MALDTDELLKEYDDLEGRRAAADEAQTALAVAIENGASPETIGMLEQERDEAIAEWGPDDYTRYREIDAFINSVGGYVTVRDGFFIDDAEGTEFAESFIHDVFGEQPRLIEANLSYEGVWEDLRADLTSVSFDGTDYWVRA